MHKPSAAKAALATLSLHLLLFAPDATSAEPSATSPVVAVTGGRLRGSAIDGILVFKGIPYAAPTGGRNRFLPPQPLRPWKSVREAMEYGAACPQMVPTGGNEPPQAGPPPNEDCLFLNVWTPALRDGRSRPVMVWLHGGGYVSGSGASAATDGQRLARRGDTVIVTLNHRLNAFGYLQLGAAAGAAFADSGNAGQLDLIAALQWVRDNIAEFGGDPRQVTIFGESGGGGKVATLMSMPQARGLFRRAILQSGFGLTAITAEEAQRTTDGVLRLLGLRADQVSELQSVPVERLRDALRTVTGGTPLGVGPVFNGHSIARHPFTPDAPPLAADIPVLAGWNKDETTVLFPPADAFDLDWAGLRKHLAVALPDADTDGLIAALRRLRPDATPSDLFFAVTTELGMGANARTLATRKAAQGGAPVWLYRMEWETPANGGRLRAHHGLDVALVFDNVAGAPSLALRAADAQRVADAMSSAWLAFARTGNPNAPGLAYWPTFDAQQQPTMVFNVVSRAVTDPVRDLRLLLASPPPRLPR